MNVVIYDGTVFWKAFSTRIWIIFWMSCHFKLKKKIFPVGIEIVVLLHAEKKTIRNPGGILGSQLCLGIRHGQAPGCSGHQEKTRMPFRSQIMTFLCSFYRWILIWNSTIGITLWRRLFPMSWDTVVRFEGGFCHLKIYYFALISFYNNRNILIWKLGINVKIQDILIFLCYKKRIWELFCLDRELERHFHSVFS